MKEENRRVLIGGLKGASKVATIAAAGSLVSGVAIVSVPVTAKVLFWTVTLATSTVVATPVVVAFAVGGAAVGFAGGATVSHLKNRRIKKEFDRLVNDNQS